jgi:dienelactone hydrolase
MTRSTTTALAACLLALIAATAAGGAAKPPRLILPPLAGRFAVGTTTLHLVDRSRLDRSFRSGKRELMVQLWYPAAATAGHPLAAYVPARTAALVEREDHAPAGLIAQIRTRAHLDAPIAAGRHPVVLYSPGSSGLRSDSTALVENLASAGYAVVTIDHTHESDAVEFLGGRLVKGTFIDTGPASNTRAVTTRVADVRFLLDQLAARHIHGLALAHIGMFGFSLGGATTAAAMRLDPRIVAGADLDGSLYGPVRRTGLRRPFLLMVEPQTMRLDPSVRSFWTHLHGPRFALELAHSRHQTFDDLVWVKPQLAHALPALARQINDVGTIDATRAIRAESAYLTAFFDRYLRDRSGTLLDHSQAYPEVTLTR